MRVLGFREREERDASACIRRHQAVARGPAGLRVHGLRVQWTAGPVVGAGAEVGNGTWSSRSHWKLRKLLRGK